MKRIFTANLLLLLGLNLIVKPFWIFGIDRTVQNTVGVAEYGLFFALFNLTLLLNILLDFGITNYNNREISRHAQLLPRYFSKIVAIKLILSVGYILVCFGLAIALGYSGRALGMLAFLALNQFLASFILYLRSNLSGLQLFRTDSLLSVTDRLLMIGLCGFLLWGPPGEAFRIEWFIYAQTAAYVITAAIAFGLVWVRSRFFNPGFDRVFLLSIGRQSLPFALLVMLMFIALRVDAVMLERMLPDGNVQSGIYAQAFRLLDAASMIPFLFSALLLPMFSRMIKQGESVKPLLGFAFNLLMVTCFGLATATIAYREPIMDSLYHQHAQESALVLGILMVAFVCVSITYIMGTLLTANGSLRSLNLICGIGVACNLGLNLVLIPRYQVVGAAISAAITQLVMAALHVLVATREFSLGASRRHLGPFLLFIGGTLLLLLISRHVVPGWLLGYGVSLLGSAALAFATGLLKPRELVALISAPHEQ